MRKIFRKMLLKDVLIPTEDGTEIIRETFYNNQKKRAWIVSKNFASNNCH